MPSWAVNWFQPKPKRNADLTPLPRSKYADIDIEGAPSRAHTRSSSNASSIVFPPARQRTSSPRPYAAQGLPPSPILPSLMMNGEFTPPIVPLQQHSMYQSLDRPSYPPLKQTFKRIQQVLRPVYPELWDTLSWPFPTSQLPALYEALSITTVRPLPPDVKEYLMLHDGQDIHSLTSGTSAHSMGLFWGLWLMNTEEIVQEWKMLRMLENRIASGLPPVDDPFQVRGQQQHMSQQMKSCPEGWVHARYSNPGWIPLIRDDAGNYIGIDLDPPPYSRPSTSNDSPWQTVAAQPGQVIAFGREIDTKTVLFPGWATGPESTVGGAWARFLSAFADDLESGEFAVLGSEDDTHGDRQRTRHGSSTSQFSNEAFDPNEMDHQNGTSSDSDDGIGEVGYFEEPETEQDDVVTSNSIGQRSVLQSRRGNRWHLKHPYKGMGVIEAMCLRSKQRWQEVAGVIPPEQSKTMSAKAMGKRPATASTEPMLDEDVLEHQPNSPRLVFSPASPEKVMQRNVSSEGQDEEKDQFEEAVFEQSIDTGQLDRRSESRGSGRYQPHKHANGHSQRRQSTDSNLSTTSRGPKRIFNPPPPVMPLSIPTLDDLIIEEQHPSSPTALQSSSLHTVIQIT